MIHKYTDSFLQFSMSLVLTLIMSMCSFAQGFEGYYQYPTIHDDLIYFTAEGDLWKVNIAGGLAQRLTTHDEEEHHAAISPDGSTIAFSASYEGPTEVYTMPTTGGLPTRWTYESDYSLVNGWTPDGRVLYDTRAYSTLPDRQLVSIDLNTKNKERIPLSQASEASYDGTGQTVYFVRPSYHGNVTKRYKGGTARQIWKYTAGASEAIKLTTDFAGESHHPTWYNGRIYHLTDRDGIMNIWSIDEDGNDLTQHTEHEGFDVRSTAVHNGHIVYQLGADIYHYDIETDQESKVNIRLTSDMDQLREKWEDNPSQYITAVNADPKGEKIVITARGRVFVAPVKAGRIVEFTQPSDIRYRDATFSSDGKDVIALSDESGEFEFVSMSADGMGASKSLTSDGDILRYMGIPSPDGEWLAYDDLYGDMFVLNIASGISQKISAGREGIYTFSWSPDSKWLAFTEVAKNTMAQLHLYHVDSKESFPITTDRANSTSPAWSPDGDFIYFISDRSFTTLVGSPWGPRQPEPYFDAKEKIYHIALQKGTRSPFRPADELPQDETEKDTSSIVKVDRDGIIERIVEVPVPAGNYRSLSANDKALYLTSRGTGLNASTDLAVIKISNEDPSVTTMVEGIRSYQLTADGKKILITKGRTPYMINAGTSKMNNINDDKIDLSGWAFAITPQEDWEQIFTDAWRMERDYFYDKNMHGVNWDAMHAKYFPLVSRITTRTELSDLIGRFVGELAALHTSVRGGDIRSDEQNKAVAGLGARFSRDEARGGFSIDYIYKADPDYPDGKSPLDDPYLDIHIGDVVTAVNGTPSLTAVDIGELVRNQVGKQVRLTISHNGGTRDIIVVPIESMYDLRYSDWEYSRRMIVEKETDQQVGYVHLRAMGSNDLNQWYREFYPVFNRPGLIVDVRHNRGGNIESFILEKLLRKAWMYWYGRSGEPSWNMQYAFRGHIVVLVDENTASDGEAFAEGFTRLDMGTSIGTRTWGGEIWLGSANRLSDNGLARAPMNGVYGEEGEWLIEGHGYEPDIVVENLPHATFNGKDAQLEAAIEFLEKLIEEDPRAVPTPPAFPDKSFKNKE